VNVTRKENQLSQLLIFQVGDLEFSAGHLSEQVCADAVLFVVCLFLFYLFLILLIIFVLGLLPMLFVLGWLVRFFRA
jgi:hypothetical protein